MDILPNNLYFLPDVLQTLNSGALSHMGPETRWQPAGHVMSQGENVSFLKAVSWVKLESRREAGFFYTNYGQLWQSALARRFSLQHDIPLRPVSPTTFHNRSPNIQGMHIVPQCPVATRQSLTSLLACITGALTRGFPTTARNHQQPLTTGQIILILPQCPVVARQLPTGL